MPATTMFRRPSRQLFGPGDAGASAGLERVGVVTHSWPRAIRATPNGASFFQAVRNHPAVARLEDVQRLCPTRKQH